MIILGIETTCDETGVGIVEDGRRVLSNIVASSAKLHLRYGGIVPEVAAREQVRLMIPMLNEALVSAKIDLGDVDAVAAAYGPGLIGSLLVGVETAKTLACTLNAPLIAVNHLVGHIRANWIDIGHRHGKPVAIGPKFPLVALIVSGGHTDLILMNAADSFRLLGSSRDDAAGEVFDKVARILGLAYPGGPQIERLALKFTTSSLSPSIKLPRPMIDDGLDFSFSGLKTAVVNLVTRDQFPKTRFQEIAYEFQNSVCEVLVEKTLRAANKYKVKSVVVGGGVAANSQLRTRMSDAVRKNGIDVFFPSKTLSVDNGAMIAAAAFFENASANPLKLQANSSLHF